MQGAPSLGSWSGSGHSARLLSVALDGGLWRPRLHRHLPQSRFNQATVHGVARTGLRLATKPRPPGEGALGALHHVLVLTCSRIPSLTPSFYTHGRLTGNLLAPAFGEATAGGQPGGGMTLGPPSRLGVGA